MIHKHEITSNKLQKINKKVGHIQHIRQNVHVTNSTNASDKP